MSVRWVIDTEHVVHSIYCAGRGTEVVPYVSAPRDHQEMYAWLVRPDQRDERHGPAAATPCRMCLPAGGVRESESCESCGDPEGHYTVNLDGPGHGAPARFTLCADCVADALNPWRPS